MSLPTSNTLPLAQGVIYTVPEATVASLSTIHVSNAAGSDQTFTVYARKPAGNAIPISVINQPILNNGVAIHAEEMRLTAGCTLEAIASAAGLSCFITGKEIAASIDQNTL